MTTFATHDAARAAGYTSPRSRATYRGFMIISRDTSGPRSYGYSYELICRPEEQFNVFGEFYFSDASWPRGHYANTASVWLTDERNALHTLGCFSVLYPPGAYEAGVEAARRAIDAFYDAHPTAAQQHCDWAAWRAQCDQRQQVKALRWIAKRAARLAERAAEGAVICPPPQSKTSRRLTGPAGPRETRTLRVNSDVP